MPQELCGQERWWLHPRVKFTDGSLSTILNHLISCFSIRERTNHLWKEPWVILINSKERDSPGKNAGVDCHALLQGISPTQEDLLCLLHWEVGSLPLAPLRNPLFWRKGNYAFWGGRRGLETKVTLLHTPWALGSEVAGNLVGKFVYQGKTCLGNGQWIEVVQHGVGMWGEVWEEGEGKLLMSEEQIKNTKARFKPRAQDFPGDTMDGDPPVSAGDPGLIPALGRFPMPQGN